MSSYESISRSEAQSFIRYLCAKLGIPLPLFKPFDEKSYCEGEYKLFTIYLKRRTYNYAALHEFLHYVLHIIKELDSSDEDNIEHRFITWIEDSILANVWQEYKGKDGKKNGRDIRSSEKRRTADSKRDSGKNRSNTV